MITAATNTQKHNAGRHLVVAEALLQGRPADLQGPRGYIRIQGTVARVQTRLAGDWQIDSVDDWRGQVPLIAILLDLSHGRGGFYICPGHDYADLVISAYDAWLGGHGGERPVTKNNKHVRIDDGQVQQWKDNWALFDRQ